MKMTTMMATNTKTLKASLNTLVSIVFSDARIVGESSLSSDEGSDSSGSGVGFSGV